MFKRMIVTVFTIAAMICLAGNAVEAAKPKLSPDKSIQLVAEGYAFGNDQNSAAENFLKTTLREFQLDSAAANQIKAVYAAKLKSVMSIQTKLKTNDSARPVVTVTATPINAAAANIEELLALKVDARMGGTEYKTRVQRTVENFINKLRVSRSPKSIDVICIVSEAPDGNLYWVPEHYSAFQNFLVPTIKLQSNAEINEVLGSLGGGFVYDSSSQTRPPVRPEPVKPEPADNQNGDNWLIYYYACGTNIETGGTKGNLDGGWITKDI